MPTSGRPGHKFFRPGLLRLGALTTGGQVYSETVTESVGPAVDLATRLLTLARTISESVGPTSETITWTKGRYVYETVGACFDTVFDVRSVSRTITETPYNAGDTVVRMVQVSRTPSETVGPANDTVLFPRINGVLREDLSEGPFVAYDTVTRVLDRVRNLLENTGQAYDTVSHAFIYPRNIAESVGPASDAVTRAATFTRRINELVGPAVDADYGYEPRAALPLATTFPYLARAWSHNWPSPTSFKRTLGHLLKRPPIKMTINGGYSPITLELGGAADRSGVTAGDVVDLVEQGTGHIVYTGIVSDDPDTVDSTGTSYRLDLDPFVTELGDVPLDPNGNGSDYSQNAIEIAKVVRNAVAQTQHLTTTFASCPDTGKTLKFTFDASYTALSTIEQCQMIAGPEYFFFVDQFGVVWFQPVQGASPANNYKIQGPQTYTVRLGTEVSKRERTGPIKDLRNHVIVIGGTPVDAFGRAQSPVRAVTDLSAGSPYGRKTLMPPITYSNNFDYPTLKAISDTVAYRLNRRITQITVDMPSLGQRVDLGRPGGCIISLFEPLYNEFNPQYQGAGGMLGPYVVLDVEIDGPSQRAILSDIPVTLDSIQYTIDQMAARTAVTSTSATQNTLPVGSGGSGSFSSGGDGSSCGGFVLLAYGRSDLTGGTMGAGPTVLGQQGFVLDSGTNCCQTVSYFAGSIRFDAPGPSPIKVQAFVDTNGGGLISSAPMYVAADGGWHAFAMVAPSLGPMPDGTYNAYIVCSNGNGTYEATWDIQTYLVGSGGSVNNSAFGATPISTGTSTGSGAPPDAPTLGSVTWNSFTPFDVNVQNPQIGGSVTPFNTSAAVPLTISVSLDNVSCDLQNTSDNALFTVHVQPLVTAVPSGTDVASGPSPAYAIPVGTAGAHASGSFSVNLSVPSAGAWVAFVTVHAQSSTASFYEAGPTPHDPSTPPNILSSGTLTVQG